MMTLDATLTVAITALVTAIPLLPRSMQMAAAVAVAVLTVLAWSRRCRAAAPVGVFCVACLVLALGGVAFSQPVLGAGLVIYAIVVSRVPWMKGAATWIRFGTFGTDVKALTAASAAIGALAVWLWYRLLEPNLDDIVERFVPDAPLGLLIAGGLVFSMVNAAVEEGAYRGVLQHGLETALGRGSAALVLQAIAFGTLHIEGFPRGAIGVGLAIIYGLLMGLIRRRANGMFAPWLAHVLTDIAIAAIILAVVWPDGQRELR